MERKELDKMTTEEKIEYLVRMYEWNCGINIFDEIKNNLEIMKIDLLKKYNI